jgi:glycine betaine/proline transport system substrate-binding protein
MTARPPIGRGLRIWSRSLGREARIFFCEKSNISNFLIEFIRYAIGPAFTILGSIAAARVTGRRSAGVGAPTVSAKPLRIERRNQFEKGSVAATRSNNDREEDDMSYANILGGTILASAMTLGSAALAADVVIGVPNWPSVSATANILKVIIEDNLGLSVELQNATNPIVFEAMDSGSMQAHPEVWLPNQQNLYDTFVKDKGTVVMNEHGVEAFQGMCVDKATADAHAIASIDDLTKPDVAALFDTDGNGKGELWIGAPGWASTNVEQVRARSYGYDQTFDLTQSDETLAYANLDNAIKAGKPWVGFCYTPHYVFALHDMTVLTEPPHDPANWDVKQPTEDPNWLADSKAGSAWESAYLHLMYQKALNETHPEVAKLFSNMALTTEEVSDMTYALVIDKKDPAAYAKEWVAAHEDAVLGWLAD